MFLRLTLSPESETAYAGMPPKWHHEINGYVYYVTETVRFYSYNKLISHRNVFFTYLPDYLLPNGPF